MAVGDIAISTLKIGDLDAGGGEIHAAGFNIYENILSPYGPVCDIQIVDPTDALGARKISGSYDKDVEIKFGLVDMNYGDNHFKFKMFRNKDLNDGAGDDTGSLKSKQYNIRGVQPEYLNAQGNPAQKSYKDLTSNIVKDILKQNFKTDKQIDIQEETKGIRRIVLNNDHPLDSLNKISNEHVSSENESSCYALFQQHKNGEQKYVFSTYEKLFQQSPVIKLTQTSTLGFDSPKEVERKQNSIRWLNVSDSFFAGSRPMSGASEQSVNLTTHGVVSTKPKVTQFQTAEGKGKGVYSDKASYSNEFPVKYIHDKANNKQKIFASEAKRKKIEFLSHLAQNSAEIEIMGNPKIHLGCMIEIDIPNKSDKQTGESQFNGKALVVAIRHKVKPLGETPRYTMILRIVKASYKEGNNNSA